MNKKSFILFSLVGLIATGCGGGGSSSSSNATLAEANIDAGKKVSKEVIGDEITYVNTGYYVRSAEEKRLNKYVSTINLVKKFTKDQSSLQRSTISQRENVSFTENCAYSGTYDIVGSIDSAKTTMSFSIDFNQCSDSDGNFDGKVNYEIRGESLNDYLETVNYIDFQILDDFTFDELNENLTFYAGSQIKLYNISGEISDYSNYSLDSYVNVHVKNETEENKIENFNFNIEISNSSTKVCYKSGTIYLNNFTEYVMIDETFDPSCNYPFIYDSTWISSGQMKVLGKNNSSIMLEVNPLGNISITDSNGTTTAVSFRE